MSLSLNYFLISVPLKQNSEPNKLETVNDLMRSVRESGDRDSKLQEFDIPQLRVGNIDSLIFLSDVLKKTGTAVEGTIKKIAAQYFELKSQPSEDQAAVATPTSKKDKMIPSILVEQSSPEDFLKRFKWDDSRYPRKKALPELTQTIKGIITNAEKELRDLSLEYNTQVAKLSQITANESGNLTTRDINAVIKEYNTGRPAATQYRPVESLISPEVKDMMADFNATSPQNQQIVPYLTSLYVVVPKNEQKTWLKSYETIVEDPHFVVPGSSVKLTEDNESAMFAVVVFSKDVEAFRNACRGKRFAVRRNDPSTVVDEEEKNKLKKNLQKLRTKVERWLVANFADVFIAWLHLKSIKCFVESILRYGLPPDFTVILISPKKGSEKKLIKFLCKHYHYLGSGFNDADDDAALGVEEKNVIGNEKYFPFVFEEINVGL